MTHAQSIWVGLVRAAERIQTYTPGGPAQGMAWKGILRDLERVCPEAFRLVAVRGPVAR